MEGVEHTVQANDFSHRDEADAGELQQQAVYGRAWGREVDEGARLESNEACRFCVVFVVFANERAK